MSILRHSEQLGNFGISLHSRIVESLVTQIEDAIEMGLIRCSLPTDDRPQLFSVFDFIRVILEIKSEREVWKRLTEGDPQTVTICDSLKFDRSNNRKGNAESPATNLTGLIYIAYMANSEFSHKLRASSAAYFAADRRPVVAPVQVEQEVAAASSDIVTDPRNVAFNDRLLRFPHPLAELQQVTGITCLQYITKAVKRDFVEGVDYVYHYPGYHLTDRAFYWLVTSFRSRRGTDIKTLPETVPLDRGGFKVRNKRKNARLGCAMGDLES